MVPIVAIASNLSECIAPISCLYVIQVLDTIGQRKFLYIYTVLGLYSVYGVADYLGDYRHYVALIRQSNTAYHQD